MKEKSIVIVLFLASFSIGNQLNSTDVRTITNSKNFIKSPILGI